MEPLDPPEDGWWLRDSPSYEYGRTVKLALLAILYRYKVPVT